jgi:hypothetical protein
MFYHIQGSKARKAREEARANLHNQAIPMKKAHNLETTHSMRLGLQGAGKWFKGMTSYATRV